MGIIQDAKTIVNQISKAKAYFTENKSLFEIFEGDLLKYVDCKMQEQLSFQSYREARHRIAPINVLTKIIDKETVIYQQNPTREVVNGTDSDQDLMQWYEEKMSFNTAMNCSNEFLNLFKNNLIEPYVDSLGNPKLRTYPSHKFWVFSNDAKDPTRPTHVVVFDSKMTKKGEEKLFRIYTETEFVIVDESGAIDFESMLMVENPDGINVIGALPFVYVNRSNHMLIPLPDTDTLSMSTLIPILLTDLNFAVMFQAFSILYGIDVDVSDLKMSPNAFWQLKSDKTSATGPQIGNIKPQVDIDQVLGLIASQFSLWLNSRGIRPGSIGSLSADNFASGVSKMIDEMDINDERKKQAAIYEDVEPRLWDLILKKMHPYWASLGMIENRALFSPNASVSVVFHPQPVTIRRGDMVRDLRDELDAGFISKRRAIKRLNPTMTDKEIDEMLAEIDVEMMAPEEFESSETDQQEQEQDGSEME